MPLLTKKLSKLNVSLQYDTITFYPTLKTEIVNNEMLMFITACGKLDFIFPGDKVSIDAIEKGRCLDDLMEFKQYDRFIHREDADHNLYHQDGFELEDTHYHFKCKSMLSQDKLKAILDIAVKHEVMTQVEAAGFLDDYNQKYQTDIQKLVMNLTESKDQGKASKKIHAFIRGCDDLDTLVYLHKALLSPQYAFLRDRRREVSSALFRAVKSPDGTVGASSKAWADIEASLELQMVHILDTTCRLSPKLGEERAKELRTDATFFGIKHVCQSTDQALEESDVMKLLKKGAVDEIEQQYSNHFKMCG